MNRSEVRRLTLPVGERDHVQGGADAPVTLVEYGDYECPYCGRAHPIVQRVQKHFGARLRFVFRNFPLTEMHPHAEHAALAAEAAGLSGKFWEMHDLLFDNQPHLKVPQLHSYADRLQIDMARYDLEMDDHVYLQRVREHMQGGRDSGVRATPTFFVDGKLKDVSFGMRSLFDAVEAALRKRSTA